MKFWLRLSNWNLAALLALAVLIAGCATGSKDDPKIATIRLHLEVNPVMERNTMLAAVPRINPSNITVSREPLLHEGYVETAELMTSGGTHQIKLTFDDSGRKVLQNYTAINVGKHIAVLGQFPTTRWLAAPKIVRPLRDGVFIFTPDADLEESRKLVDGLALVIKKRKKNSLFK